MYSKKSSSQGGREKGKAQHEHDDGQEGEKAGKPNAKKAGITPSLLRNDRLMQGCLGPAHGMHTSMKPDPMTWGYPSKGAGYISFAQQECPNSYGVRILWKLFFAEAPA